MAGPALAAGIAALLAAPWLDQRLVWCEWAGVAAALLLVGRIRGWWGEFWAIAAASAALAAAFHWTPRVLAGALDSSLWVGLAVAAPIVLWDAIRAAAPILLASRLRADPLSAWVPAGLAAVTLEAITPAVFPWKLGYAQIAWPQFVQSADLLGPESTTLITYAHAGLVAWLVRLVFTDGKASLARQLLSPPPAVVAAAGLCIANLAYGTWAVTHWTRVAAEAPRVDVVLVQANPEEADGVDTLRALTESACAATAGPPDLVCWPESSGGCYDERLESFADPGHVARLSREPAVCLRPLDAPPCPILFGGKFFRGHPDKPQALYQSGILVDETHTIIGRYHKRHLMPFGEYVPGEDWYPEIKRHFRSQDALTEGVEPTVMPLGGDVRLGTMLCYEDMISSAARSMVANGATLLVSLVNGSAFTAPLTLRQHRLLAQLRAVETRRCLVRCAATGETCVITPTGTISAALPLHDRALLRAEVPLLDGRTPYSRTGRVLPGVCALAVGALIWRYRKEARSRERWRPVTPDSESRTSRHGAPRTDR